MIYVNSTAGFAKLSGDDLIRLLQSLTRGLKALDILRAAEGPLRLTAIAHELGVEKSNASHILKTLVAAGYAGQDDSRRYLALVKDEQPVTGPSLSEVVACKEYWRPVVASLAEKTGECVHLAVLVDDCVWYIDKVDSALPLKVDHPIGSLSPLHCTALGKAFIAFSPAKIPARLHSFTRHTITDPAQLQAEIVASKMRGYAIDDEEFAQGIRCVACPLFDQRGDMLAALGVSGPSVRIDHNRLDELGATIRNAIVAQGAA